MFFFNDTATTEIYTLSLHDALPICEQQLPVELVGAADELAGLPVEGVRRGLEVAGVDVHDVGDRVDQQAHRDRKSTRLNSSHANISYAVFCLKKKKTTWPMRYSIDY